MAEEKQETSVVSSPSRTNVGEAKGPPQGPRGPPPEVLLPRWRLIVLSIALCLGLFLSFLDSSIVSTALYTIGTDFESLTSINWIALAYTLSDLGCAVFFTSMSDVVGRKNAYIVAFTLFFSASIGCGFAQNVNQLIALRAVQGVGGGGLYSLAMVLFPEIFPRKMRKWIGAIAGGVVGTSGIMGPVLGGIITHYATWRWIFWLNAPVGAVGITMFFLAWPKPGQMKLAERKPLNQVDFVGGFLLIAASVLVVFAFQESGVHWNFWGTALFIGPVVAGSICWLTLAGWEFAIQKLWQESISPLFPASLMKRRVYIAGALTALFTGFPYYVVIYNVPLHLQVVNGRSPLAAGLGLLPLLAATAIGSTVSGAISSKNDFTFYTLTVGSCLLTLGIGLLSTVSGSAKVDSKIYGFEVLVGLGFGLSVSTSSLLAATQCEIKDHATAQGLIAQARVLGGSFGIAASTAIMGVYLSRELAGIVPSSELRSLDFAIMSPTQVHGVRQAYAHAFDQTLRVSAILSGLSIAFALLAWQRSPMSLQERTALQVRIEGERQREMAMKRMNLSGMMGPGASSSPLPTMRKKSGDRAEEGSNSS